MKNNRAIKGDKSPIIDVCVVCKKPYYKCYCLECLEYGCGAKAPFIKETKNKSCLHKCSKCGHKFLITEDGDIKDVE